MSDWAPISLAQLYACGAVGDGWHHCFNLALFNSANEDSFIVACTGKSGALAAPIRAPISGVNIIRPFDSLKRSFGAAFGAMIGVGACLKLLLFGTSLGTPCRAPICAVFLLGATSGIGVILGGPFMIGVSFGAVVTLCAWFGAESDIGASTDRGPIHRDAILSEAVGADENPGATSNLGAVMTVAGRNVFVGQAILGNRHNTGAIFGAPSLGACSGASFNWALVGAIFLPLTLPSKSSNAPHKLWG